MEKIIRSKYTLIPDFSEEDNKNSSSDNFSIPNHKGKVGFISSMTNKFCSSCNRVRLTADGNLKVCLFGKEETNLLKMIRENKSEEYIKNSISQAVKQKKKEHGGMFDLSLKSSENRPMIKIGG